MNSDARAAFGRGLLLQAIRAEGAAMPPGFDREGVSAPGLRNPLGAAKGRRGPGKVRAGGTGDRAGHRRSQGTAKTANAATAAEPASTATGDAGHARPTGFTG